MGLWSPSLGSSRVLVHPGGVQIPARRTRGEFLPSNISGLAAWWDASDLSTLWQDSARSSSVASDGDPIGAIDDKSGNGRHILQATSAARPTYKTAIKNSRSIARFDGTDDYMGLASYDPGSAHTIFAVYTATSGYVFRHNTDTYVYPAGGASTSVIGSAQSAYDVTETLTGGWKVIAQKYNGTHATHLLRVNGAAATQSTVYFSFDPGDQASATFHIGSPSGAQLTADIAELLIYDSNLSSDDTAAVESYLNTKWAVY